MPQLAKPAKGPVTSRYGLRPPLPFHNGIDFGWLNADPVASRRVYSAHPGTVVDAGYSSAPGNYVLVDIGGGYKVRYIHLSTISVRVGQKVGYSTLIGVMGDTGTSTLPGQVHLHMDLFRGDTRINPEPYITLPFGYTGPDLSGGGTAPIEDEDMAHFEIIVTPDGTAWWCVDRIHRYAIPSSQNLSTYQQFHRELKGRDVVVTRKTDAEANAYGQPVYSAPLTPQTIASAVKAALGSVSGGGQVDADAVAAAVEARLADNFAAIPAAVNSDLKARL